MKNRIIQIPFLAGLVLAFLLTVGKPGSVFSQTEEVKRARITLDYFSINNENQKLVATVKTRIEGFFENVTDLNVWFYKNSIDEENLLGNILTDENGQAILKLADTSLWSKFISVIKDQPGYRDVEKEIEITRAYLEFSTEVLDSVKTMKILVTAPDSTGIFNPAKDIDVQVYVERLFGLLPISDEVGTTDEAGTLTIPLISDIPGDENGNIKIIAKVSDHENYGNLEFSKIVPWGLVTDVDLLQLEKELWLSSSNTSKVLVGIVTFALIAILGVVMYILNILVKIKKLGLEVNPK